MRSDTGGSDGLVAGAWTFLGADSADIGEWLGCGESGLKVKFKFRFANSGCSGVLLILRRIFE
jgi:hypothetical protein